MTIKEAMEKAEPTISKLVKLVYEQDAAPIYAILAAAILAKANGKGPVLTADVWQK